MKPVPGLIITAALLTPSLAQAQASQPATASERRLSPQQIEEVLSEAAKKREATAIQDGPQPIGPSAEPQVHGEVGFAIGTGGYREVFGSAIYPVGDGGAAAISLDFIDLGKRRNRR